MNICMTHTFSCSRLRCCCCCLSEKCNKLLFQWILLCRHCTNTSVYLDCKIHVHMCHIRHVSGSFQRVSGCWLTIVSWWGDVLTKYEQFYRRGCNIPTNCNPLCWWHWRFTVISSYTSGCLPSNSFNCNLWIIPNMLSVFNVKRRASKSFYSLQLASWWLLGCRNYQY